MRRRPRPPSDEIVIRAWQRNGGRRPAAVESIGRGRSKKSALFRLVGVGDGGSPVVAKLCRGGRATAERRIYEEVLARLPIPLPRFYGSVEEPEGVWLFLEDGGSTRCDVFDSEHRALAGRWLATLHGTASREPRPDLPDRGPGYYLERLRSAKSRILEHLETAACEAEKRALLDSVLERFDQWEARWGEIEAACAPLPRTLVHGDFCRKNLHVRERRGGLEVFPMDWEYAGWGVPAADIWPTRRTKVPLPDAAAYGAVLRDHWPDSDPTLPQRLAALGRVFRNLAAMDWASVDLSNPYMFPYLSLYLGELCVALRETDWVA